MKNIYNFFYKNIPDTFKALVKDTLMKNVGGVYKFSRTSLTMFSAWIVSLHMAYYDMYKNGFHMEVFLTLVGVALGSKVTDSISKKLHTPNSGSPTDTE